MYQFAVFIFFNVSLICSFLCVQLEPFYKWMLSRSAVYLWLGFCVDVFVVPLSRMMHWGAEKPDISSEAWLLELSVFLLQLVGSYWWCSACDLQTEHTVYKMGRVWIQTNPEFVLQIDGG